MRYLDPKNDLTFKKIFFNHPNILISLLNGLMDFEDGREVVSIEYLNPELAPLSLAMKNTIVDVRCLDNFNRQFIIELQMVFEKSFYKRVLFNIAKVYSYQLKKRDSYKKSWPIFSINLVNDDMKLESNDYYHNFQFLNKKQPEWKLFDIEIMFIEIRKFKEQNFADKKLKFLWLKFFAFIENKTEMVPQDILEVPEIAEAVNLLQESSFSDTELMQYDRYLDEIMIQNTLVDVAEEAKAEAEEAKAQTEEAKAQTEEAKAQTEEAKAQTEEAKAQTEEAILNLKKLILFSTNSGSSIMEIAQAIGLSEEDVKNYLN